MLLYLLCSNTLISRAFLIRLAYSMMLLAVIKHNTAEVFSNSSVPESVLMVRMFWLISVASIAPVSNVKSVLQVTCWFRNWKWSTELLLLRWLFRVWPRWTATESWLLTTWWLSSARDLLQPLAVSVQFLTHHSGSVWRAWSQLPRGGRQMYDWKTTEPEVLSPERCPLGRKVVTHWHSGVWETVAPSARLWMRRALTLADLVSLVGPVFAQT